jgi:hypothetical protein
MASGSKKNLTPEVEVGLKPEEMLKVFRPILRSVLAKEFEKAIKNGDEEKLKL